MRLSPCEVALLRVYCTWFGSFASPVINKSSETAGMADRGTGSMGSSRTVFDHEDGSRTKNRGLALTLMS